MDTGGKKLFVLIKGGKVMRDPNRIYPFCMKLAELWSNYPDLRFGQIMSNVFSCIEGEDWHPFYVEDDEMMEYINHQLRKE